MRGRVAAIGDRGLGGRRMMDRPHPLSGTLAECLEERLLLFREPPDEEWVQGLIGPHCPFGHSVPDVLISRRIERTRRRGQYFLWRYARWQSFVGPCLAVGK